MAKWLRRLTSNQKIEGSIPSRGYTLLEIFNTLKGLYKAYVIIKDGNYNNVVKKTSAKFGIKQNIKLRKTPSNYVRERHI